MVPSVVLLRKGVIWKYSNCASTGVSERQFRLGQPLAPNVNVMVDCPIKNTSNSTEYTSNTGGKGGVAFSKRPGERCRASSRKANASAHQSCVGKPSKSVAFRPVDASCGWPPAHVHAVATRRRSEVVAHRYCLRTNCPRVPVSWYAQPCPTPV